MQNNNATSLMFEPTLRKEELDFYKSLFESIKEPSGNIALSENLAPLLKNTKLDVHLLATIWDLCDVEMKGCFTQTDFFCCMKFVAACQNGLALNNEVLDKTNLPLARIYSKEHALKEETLSKLLKFATRQKLDQFYKFFTLEQQNSHVSGINAKNIFTKYNLDHHQLLELWSLVDVYEKGKLNGIEFIIAMLYLEYFYYSRDNVEIPEKIPGEIFVLVKDFYEEKHRFEQKTIPNGTELSTRNKTEGLFLKNIQRYKNDYRALDLDNQSCVKANELVPYFKESGLHHRVLAQIWDLADIDKIGKLNEERFLLAMALIEIYKANGELPLSPPLDLSSLLTDESLKHKLDTDTTGFSSNDPGCAPTVAHKPYNHAYEDSGHYASNVTTYPVQKRLSFLSSQVEQKEIELIELEKRLKSVTESVQKKERRLKELEMQLIRKNANIELSTYKYNQATEINSQLSNELNSVMQDYKDMSDKRNFLRSKSELQPVHSQYPDFPTTRSHLSNEPIISQLQNGTISGSVYSENTSYSGSFRGKNKDYSVDGFSRNLPQSSIGTRFEREPKSTGDDIFLNTGDHSCNTEGPYKDGGAYFKGTNLDVVSDQPSDRKSSIREAKPYNSDFLTRSFPASTDKTKSFHTTEKHTEFSPRYENNEEFNENFLNKNIEEELPDGNDLFKI